MLATFWEEEVTANSVQVIGEGEDFSVWTEGSSKVICSISRSCGCTWGGEVGELWFPCKGEGSWEAGTEISQWIPSGPACEIVGPGGGGPGGVIPTEVNPL